MNCWSFNSCPCLSPRKHGLSTLILLVFQITLTYLISNLCSVPSKSDWPILLKQIISWFLASCLSVVFLLSPYHFFSFLLSFPVSCSLLLRCLYSIICLKEVHLFCRFITRNNIYYIRYENAYSISSKWYIPSIYSKWYSLFYFKIVICAFIVKFIRTTASLSSDLLRINLYSILFYSIRILIKNYILEVSMYYHYFIGEKIGFRKLIYAE